MLDLLREYQYLILFIGLLVGGETVLLPAVYLAITGHLQWAPLLSITLATTLLSDSAWFYLGRWLSLDRIRRWPGFRRRQSTLDRISHLFALHGLKLLFLSKFLYGTRILTQVISGATGIGYGIYVLINTLSVLAWIAMAVLLGLLVGQSLEALEWQFFRGQFFFALFLIAVISAQLWIRKLINARWFQPLSRLSTKQKPLARS